MRKKNQQNTPTRADWEANHWRIYDAYINHFNEHKRPPTQTKLAEITGLDRSTIANHIKDSTLTDIIPSVRMRTMRVLNGLANRAEKGYAAEVKLWMQIVEGWREVMGIDNIGQPITSINVTVREGKPKQIQLDEVPTNGSES